MLTRALCACLLVCFCAKAAQAQRFEGDIDLRLLDGDSMMVLRTFSFVNKDNRRWEVPANFKTDGASIPRALWSVIGSPFTGKYVAAAIVHDRFCETKTVPWKEVHQVFYDAMLAKEVNMSQAKLIYYAVLRFGPKWVVKKELGCPPDRDCAEAMSLTRSTAIATRTSNEEEMEAELRIMEEVVRRENFTPEQIQQRSLQRFLEDTRPYETSSLYSWDRRSTPIGVGQSRTATARQDGIRPLSLEEKQELLGMAPTNTKK